MTTLTHRRHAVPPVSPSDLINRNDGPLSDEEQVLVLQHLEDSNAASSTAFVAILACLHIVLAGVFFWLTVKGERLVVVDHVAEALRRGLPSAQGITGHGVMQLLNSVCLTAGGVGLVHFRPKRQTQSAKDNDDGEAPSCHFNCDRARRFQRCVALLALLPAFYVSVEVLSSNGSEQTSSEWALLWFLVWWQPAFHVAIGHTNSVLQSTLTDLELLRSKKYHHEKA